ncbi:TPA: ABC transporter ATP-binding protein [Aeromonas sobria]|nr:ABC transporter ATP-binding protein [Aeromonas sobria]
MSSNEISISVKQIGKCFNVYNHPRDRLKQFFLPRIKSSFGFKTESYYKEFWALHDISFDVKKGETVGIIGKNGSGKSTLLQIICGTLEATQGKVETKGRIAALLELGSGFNPEFSGRENVYLNAAILGLSKEEIDSKFDEIISFADIGDFIEQPVKTYSSGMVVRLAFAVQAQINPDILIVDEALAVGDAKFQAKCFERLRQLKNSGTSILLVTHSGEQIVTHCDRAIFINEGRLIYQGGPKLAVNMYMDILFGKNLVANDANQPYVRNTNKKVRNGKNNIETLSIDADCFSLKPNYNKNEYRWGDGRASWLDYQLSASGAINPTLIHANEKVNIICSMKFSEEIHNPIIGFAIKTKEGITVYNTNTHLLAKSTLELGSKYSVGVVEFEFLNKLGAGDYFISLGIASMENSDVIPHDRRYDSIHFLVPTVDDFSGLINLDLDLKVNVIER